MYFFRFVKNIIVNLCINESADVILKISSYSQIRKRSNFIPLTIDESMPYVCENTVEDAEHVKSADLLLRLFANNLLVYKKKKRAKSHHKIYPHLFS